MSLAESYQALSTLLQYPEDKNQLLQCLAALNSHIEACHLEQTEGSFREFLAGSTLPELQEDFVTNFDFNPAKAPYLGHHLFGDNQKKAAYMIKLKQEYALFGFSPQENELPDHLSVLLAFLAHLAAGQQEEYRRQFIAKEVLPGVRKLTASSQERTRSPWLPMIETAEQLLSDDCKEVSQC